MAKKILKVKQQRPTSADIIVFNIVFLCENTTNLSVLTMTLVAARVISEVEQQDIMAKKSDFDKCCQLYTLVNKKGSSGFKSLMDALRTTGNEHLYKLITEKLEEAENVNDMDSDSDCEDGKLNKPIIDLPNRQIEETDNSANLASISKRRQEIMKVVGWSIASFAILMAVIFGFRIFYPSTERPTNITSFDIPNKVTTTDALKKGGQTPEIENSSESAVTQETNTEDDYDDIEPPSSELSFLRFTINSPVTLLPTKLASPAIRLNLTISSTVKYDWRYWPLRNPRNVYSLSLKGCFNESDAHYFLQNFKNLRSLDISRGAYLCQEFTGETSENGLKRLDHHRLEHLDISVLPECELLYKYLADMVYFHNLKSIALINSYITFVNFELIDKLFCNHEKQLVRVYLINVTLCEECILFNSPILFPHLDMAKLYFLSFNSTAAVKTLRNFSVASPLLREFHTNISCDVMDTRIFQKGWKHLDYDESKLCQD